MVLWWCRTDDRLSAVNVLESMLEVYQSSLSLHHPHLQSHRLSCPRRDGAVQKQPVCKALSQVWLYLTQHLYIFEFSWLGFLGWCMTFSSIWLIPAYAIYLYFQQDGTPMERFTKISSAKALLPKSLSKDANRVNIRTSQDISFKTSVNATAL